MRDDHDEHQVQRREIPKIGEVEEHAHERESLDGGHGAEAP